MASLTDIQAALREAGIDGWLFADFRRRDPISYHILGLDQSGLATRRWFYFVPAKGVPTKIVSAVEPGKLDTLEGSTLIYRSWPQLHEFLHVSLDGSRRVAMQYSPNNNIPYVAIADAGTIDLVRSFGVEVVSSASLVQRFDGLVDGKGYESHLRAGRLTDRIKDESFELIGHTLREGGGLTEFDVASFILRRIEEEGMTSDGTPIVGVNEHPADPHFEPTSSNAKVIQPGDTLLIDLWAKMNTPGSIYYDITWCGFSGRTPPARYLEIWRHVVDARDAAVAFVRKKLERGETPLGFEADDAARKVINDAGYGDHFVHRTGHSIGEEDHGNGANIDNLETHDDRPLVPGALFSIEPGIYLPGQMAVRTEVDVYVTADGRAEVTGPAQRDLILIDVAS